jgi:hypothetical protein
MSDDEPTFRCPIDGRSLAEGKPCPDHGIAFRANREGAVVASTRPLRSDAKPAAKPAARRKR